MRYDYAYEDMEIPDTFYVGNEDYIINELVFMKKALDFFSEETLEQYAREYVF